MVLACLGWLNFHYLDYSFCMIFGGEDFPFCMLFVEIAGATTRTERRWASDHGPPSWRPLWVPWLETFI